jgi:hypothetical protein
MDLCRYYIFVTVVIVVVGDCVFVSILIVLVILYEKIWEHRQFKYVGLILLHPISLFAAFVIPR